MGFSAGILGAILYIQHITGFISLFFIIVALIGCCFGESVYKAIIEKRGRQVQAYLDKINPLWSARDYRWTTNKYGAYLILSYSGVAKNLQNRNRPGNSARSGLNSNVHRPLQSPDVMVGGPLTGPAPMGGGNETVTPTPMPAKGPGNQSARTNQVGPQNSVSPDLAPLDPEDGFGNNVVVI